MKLQRRKILEHKEAFSSLCTKEFPVSSGALETLTVLYSMLNAEVRNIEMFNNSLLARFGMKDEDKGTYFIEPTNPNFQQYMEERTSYIMSEVELPVKQITILELETLGIKLRPFENHALRDCGMLINT